MTLIALIFECDSDLIFDFPKSVVPLLAALSPKRSLSRAIVAQVKGQDPHSVWFR